MILVGGGQETVPQHLRNHVVPTAWKQAALVDGFNRGQQLKLGADMSHFAVLVIGPNVKEQLQPYHEFECTGEDDQYVQDVDITEECRSGGLDGYGLEDETVASESEVNLNDTHKYGFAVVDGEGNIIKAVKRTNPNKKWDWWVVGGRWSGFLKLKAGATGDRGRPGLMGSQANSGDGYADVALKGDVDFDGMRDEAGREAAVRWDKANTARDGKTWETWEHLRDVVHAGNIGAARDAYHVQEAKDAVAKAMGHPWDGVDEYLTPRDQYIQQARDSATVLYAFVKDGQWIAKGTMGWFGMSDEDGTQEDWNKKVNEMLDALPDDTLITVVDCHI
ncbi:hypothetical protein ACLPHM_06015 [Paenalcaligenes sp. Me131]|uniref:hypothetical protein n=1 Tax=Paenalcaligenes sp. Me131 TaxID=3392636 RepID=UPI003D2C8D85